VSAVDAGMTAGHWDPHRVTREAIIDVVAGAVDGDAPVMSDAYDLTGLPGADSGEVSGVVERLLWRWADTARTAPPAPTAARAAP
jgi:hypothetical protein